MQNLLPLVGGEQDVTEVALLMPGWQLAALGHIAEDQQQSLASVVRHAIADFLNARRERTLPCR